MDKRYLTYIRLLTIIYLTRESMASAHLAAGKMSFIRNSAQFTRQGRYFLCLKIVTTRVMTAQSIITNVNKSEYVTIGTNLLP